MMEYCSHGGRWIWIWIWPFDGHLKLCRIRATSNQESKACTYAANDDDNQRYEKLSLSSIDRVGRTINTIGAEFESRICQKRKRTEKVSLAAGPDSDTDSSPSMRHFQEAL